MTIPTQSAPLPSDAWRRIVDLVNHAGITGGRQPHLMLRRCIKFGEELGEVQQAWLSVTSRANQKDKTWDDVEEEAVDCLIMALDIALTMTPPKDVYIHEALLNAKPRRMAACLGTAVVAQGRLLTYFDSVECGDISIENGLFEYPTINLGNDAVQSTLSMCLGIICGVYAEPTSHACADELDIKQGLERISSVVQTKTSKWIRNVEKAVDTVTLPFSHEEISED